MGRQREFEGATLDEAKKAAAASLGVPEPDLHYKILETGRRGVFGLGARKVRISVDPDDHERPKAPGADARSEGSGGRRDGGRRGGRRRGSRQEGRRRSEQGRRAEADQGGEGPVEPRRDELLGSAPRAEDGARSREGRRGGSRGEHRRPSRRRRGERRRGGGRGEGGGAAERRQSREARNPQDGPGADRADRPARSEPVSPEVAQSVVADVRRMFELMELNITVEPVGGESGVRIQLDGEDRKVLVQKEAEFLGALQFLLNRMSRRAWPEAGRIQLSCDGYHSQRDEELVELAKEVAGQVARTGQAKQLHPMNPYERRLVHVTVREYAELESRSEGDGFLKKIRISRK